LAFIFIESAHAIPVKASRFNTSTNKRQAASPDTPLSFQRVRQTNTPDGVVTETCTVTLNPIVGPDNQPLVLEDETCTVTVNSGEEEDNTTNNIDATTTFSIASPPPQAVTTFSALTSDIEASPTSISLSVFTPVFPDTTTTPAAAEATIAPATIFTPLFATASSSSSSTTSTAPTGTADAANASQTTQSFTLPGQKLQVLPIGLGVFAGISVIALIVVGLVTYERTKYRKAFRARKLAEAGAAMGYGGTGI